MTARPMTAPPERRRMRRAALAALVSAGAVRPAAAARPGLRSRPQHRGQDPLGHPLAAFRGQRQLQPRRPLPGHQLLHRHPGEPRIPERDRHPDLHARARHRPARALGGGGGLRVHRRLADLRQHRLRQRMGERNFRRRPRIPPAPGGLPRIRSTTSSPTRVRCRTTSTSCSATPTSCATTPMSASPSPRIPPPATSCASSAPRSTIPRTPRTRRPAPRWKARPPGTCG